jgi:AraC family transcriptional regulator, ethanolamine operon transcriptional activator
MQVEPGRFAGSLTSIRLKSVRLFRDRFNVGSERQGDLAPGKLLLGTTDIPETATRWFGMRVTAEDVAIGRRSVDVRVSGAGAYFGVLIDRAVVSHPFCAENGVAAPASEAYLVRSPENAARLRTFLRAVFRLGETAPHALRPPSTRGDVEDALVSILRTPVDGRRVIAGNSAEGRFAAVRLCETYMREHIDEPISLQNLSDASGCRPRSLINAFEAFTGLSPMAYLKAKRLNGVRKTLLSTLQHQVRIIDIAMDWGFEHMGHFAADYRAMFGERPSGTERAQPRADRRVVDRIFAVDERTRLRRAHFGMRAADAAQHSQAALFELMNVALRA